MDEYLSIKEFAVLVKVHHNTVRRAIKTGRLQAFKIGNKCYRIPKSEIGRIALFDLKDMVEKIIEHKQLGK